MESEIGRNIKASKNTVCGSNIFKLMSPGLVFRHRPRRDALPSERVRGGVWWGRAAILDTTTDIGCDLDLGGEGGGDEQQPDPRVNKAALGGLQTPLRLFHPGLSTSH